MNVDAIVDRWEAFAHACVEARLEQTSTNLREAAYRKMHPEEDLVACLWQHGMRPETPVVEALDKLDACQEAKDNMRQLRLEWRDYQWDVRRHPNVYVPLFQAQEPEFAHPGEFAKRCFSRVTFANMFGPGNPLWERTCNEVPRPPLLNAMCTCMMRRQAREDAEKRRNNHKRVRQGNVEQTKRHAAQDAQVARVEEQRARLQTTVIRVTDTIKAMREQYTIAKQEYKQKCTKRDQSINACGSIQGLHLLKLSQLRDALREKATQADTTDELRRYKNKMEPKMNAWLTLVSDKLRGLTTTRAMLDALDSMQKEWTVRKATHVQNATMLADNNARVRVMRKSYVAHCRKQLRSTLNTLEKAANRCIRMLQACDPWPEVTSMVEGMEALCKTYEADAAVIGDDDMVVVREDAVYVEALADVDLDAYQGAVLQPLIHACARETDATIRSVVDQELQKFRERGIDGNTFRNGRAYIQETQDVYTSLHLLDEPVLPGHTADALLESYVTFIQTTLELRRKAIVECVEPLEPPSIPALEGFLDWFVDDDDAYAFLTDIGAAFEAQKGGVQFGYVVQRMLVRVRDALV